jgi:hypothetical protein
MSKLKKEFGSHANNYGNALMWISPPEDPAALLELSYQANNIVSSLYFKAILG